MAAIIFDMDGTIADSFDYVAEFMAEEAGKAPLTEEQKQRLRGLSMIDMARRLGYHWWDGPRLLFKGQRRMRRDIKQLDSFEGIPEIIRKLSAEGHELFVLSTNSSRNIQQFLHDQKINKYFLEIYGGVGIFGKASALKQLLKKQNLAVKQAVYVGDELRDIQAAQSIGMKAVAVSWGFAHRSGLLALRPTAIVDTPDELMRTLEEI
ncbi:MAG: HAD-IA family hydrolase [Patescibacteria group bacterium]